MTPVLYPLPLNWRAALWSIVFVLRSFQIEPIKGSGCINVFNPYHSNMFSEPFSTSNQEKNRPEISSSCTVQEKCRLIIFMRFWKFYTKQAGILIPGVVD